MEEREAVHIPRLPEVMDELAWQRSAVEFLPEVVNRGTNTSQYASVLEALAKLAARFDAWCRQQLAAGGVGKPQPPPLQAGYWWDDIHAVPESHWWWRVTPVPGYYEDNYDDFFGDSDIDSDDPW